MPYSYRIGLMHVQAADQHLQAAPHHPRQCLIHIWYTWFIYDMPHSCAGCRSPVAGSTTSCVIVPHSYTIHLIYTWHAGFVYDFPNSCSNVRVWVAQYIIHSNMDLIQRNNTPRGGFLFTMFPHQEPCVRGPPSKDLYQVLRGGSSHTRFLMN